MVKWEVWKKNKNPVLGSVNFINTISIIHLTTCIYCFLMWFKNTLCFRIIIEKAAVVQVFYSVSCPITFLCDVIAHSCSARSNLGHWYTAELTCQVHISTCDSVHSFTLQIDRYISVSTAAIKMQGCSVPSRSPLVLPFHGHIYAWLFPLARWIWS